MSTTTTATVADARRLARRALQIGWSVVQGTHDPAAHMARMLDGAMVLGALGDDMAPGRTVDDLPVSAIAALERVAAYVHDDCHDLLEDPDVVDSRPALIIHRDRAERVLAALGDS